MGGQWHPMAYWAQISPSEGGTLSPSTHAGAARLPGATAYLLERHRAALLQHYAMAWHLQLQSNQEGAVWSSHPDVGQLGKSGLYRGLEEST